MASVHSAHTSAPSDVEWKALYQRFSTEAHPQPLPPGMIKLKYWPDLACVPEELISSTTRICALLWRKPTASHLIARVLDEDRRHIHALLQTLNALGHIEFAGQEDATPATGAAESETREEMPAAGTGSRLSFIDKLRQQLLGQR